MEMKILENLKLGKVELPRLQKLINENNLLLFDTLVEDYGLILSQTDTDSFGTNWLCSKTGNLSIQIKAGKAIVFDELPRKIELSSDLTYNFVADGTYKILVKYATTNIEAGTVSLNNGSKIVAGSGTKFTELFAQNRRIIIDSTAYQIYSVESDTQLTLVSNYTGSNLSGKQFKVGGWFVGYPAGIDDNLIYEYDSLSVVAKTGAKLDNEYWIAEVVVSGGSITQVTDKRSQNIFKLFGNVPTIFGTPASSFQVGGRYVEVESDVPNVPLNIRVTDINGVKLRYVEDAIKGNISDEAYHFSTNKLRITIKWGYEDITGNGGSNTFTIINHEFTENALAGYYLYIPTLSKNLKIVSNLAGTSGQTVCTVTNEDGTSWDGTGVSVSSTPALIHTNADEYSLIAIPQKDSVYTYESREEKLIKFAESPTKMSTEIELETGTKYLIKVKAGKKGKFSNYAEMPSGTFMKYNVAQTYDKPLLVKHPNIATEGTLTVTTSRNGFVVNVSGWTEAEQYEIIYTTKAGGANFTDPTVGRQVIYNPKYLGTRSVDIPTLISANYNVKVRPLIAGQQVVTTPLSANVVSGSAGNMPGDQVILSTYITHKTYSGTLAWNSQIGVATVTDIVTPASGTQSVTSLSGELEGCILTDSAGNDFLIAGVLGANVFELINLKDKAYTPQAGTCTIGVSKRGRMIYKSNKFTIDYEIVRIDFDCDIKRGENVTLRAYQQGKEESADTLLINASDSPFTTECNVMLLGVYGDRNLIVDLYDPAGTYNKGCLSGQLTIYARPYSYLRDKFQSS